MEFIKSLDPQALAAWIQLLVIVVGLIGALYTKYQDQVKADKLSRWDFIKQAVPEVHGVVQRLAKLTKTKKDDSFVDVMDKLLTSMGLAPVQHNEKEAVKALGTGYHQEYKLARDGAVTVNVAEPAPSEALLKITEELKTADPCQEPALPSAG